jgi:hypothetical protein
MATPPYDDLEEMITFRLTQTNELLDEFEYEVIKSTPEEFYAFLSGDKISNERVTLRDIIGNEYMMVHVVVELSELKRQGLTIGEKTVSDTDKEKLYEAHLRAADYEMGYAMLIEDYYWMKHRLDYLVNMIENDKNLPEALKPAASKIYENFKPYLNY